MLEWASNHWTEIKDFLKEIAPLLSVFLGGAFFEFKFAVVQKLHQKSKSVVSTHKKAAGNLEDGSINPTVIVHGDNNGIIGVASEKEALKEDPVKLKKNDSWFIEHMAGELDKLKVNSGDFAAYYPQGMQFVKEGDFENAQICYIKAFKNFKSMELLTHSHGEDAHVALSRLKIHVSALHLNATPREFEKIDQSLRDLFQYI